MRLLTKVVLVVLAITLVPSVASATGVMFVKNNRVGIGIDNPAKALHVQGTTSDVQVKVVNNSGTTARRNLFDMSNNGQVLMALNDTALGIGWQFGTRSTRFEFSLGGSGAVEYVFNRFGTATALQAWVDGSSREIKHEFRAIDQQEMLDKVLGLELTEWSYRTDGTGARHFGPMAEDFYATFGLGINNKSIASLDTAGVSLAAIQGLHQRMVEKDARIESLQAENADLVSRLQALESRLVEVELATAILSGTSDPVARTASH